MRIPVVAITAIAMGLTACSSGGAEESGPQVSRSFPVGAFDKIQVAGPYTVEVATGRRPQVSATGPSGMVEKMVVEVKDNTLSIHPEKKGGMFGGMSFGGDHGTVKVSVGMQTLNAAALAGSGGLSVDRLATQEFKGAVAGSGGLKLPNVEVQSLRIEIAGSGSADVSGRAREARYAIAGSGNIQAGRLASEQARIEVMGSGEVAANATSTAKVDIAGSGNVRVTGGAKCSVSKAGSGDVQCS